MIYTANAIFTVIIITVNGVVITVSTLIGIAEAQTVPASEVYQVTVAYNKKGK